MRIDAAAPVRRPLTLTPLIDVIFLLLLFFMLSSTFLKYARIEIAGGYAGRQAAVQTPDLILRIHADGRLDLNGVVVERPGLVEAVAAYHERGARSLAVVPLEGADVQALVSVLELVRTGPISAIRLAR